MIVDLRELEFMDSSGMHALAAADARARASGARLVIAHPAESVLRLLELTGMRQRSRWSKGPEVRGVDSVAACGEARSR